MRNKKNKTKKIINNLKLAEDLGKMIGKIVLSFIVIYVTMTAVFYTAIWFFAK